MLQIEELILRIPGLSSEEARNLGEEVASRVTNRLPAQHRDGNLGALDLRVTIPPGTSRSRMAILIAEAILKGL